VRIEIGDQAGQAGELGALGALRGERAAQQLAIGQRGECALDVEREAARARV
jgi:hypothetical protein